MIQELFKKFSGLFYDATVGVLKQYKRTTIDIARIELATFYVKVIRLIRQEVLTSTMIIFGVIVFANAMGVVQVAILLFAPWHMANRIIAALLLGIVCSLVPLAIVLRLFSEKRWMQMTKADQLIADIIGNSQNGSS